MEMDYLHWHKTIPDGGKTQWLLKKHHKTKKPVNLSLSRDGVHGEINHETMKPINLLTPWRDKSWNYETCQHLAVQRWRSWRDKPWNQLTSCCPEMEDMEPWNLEITKLWYQETCQHLAVQRWSAWSERRDKPWNHESRFRFPICNKTWDTTY